jgi:hypothetical protein
LLKAVFPYNGNPKELLLLNKKAIFSLNTRHHFRLSGAELALLQRTLDLDVNRRANSRELLDVYIKNYEKEVGGCDRKDRASKHTRTESMPSSTRGQRFESGNSI